MSRKKEDEPVQVKDTSRPARDAESMKQTTGMSQSEWEDIKRNGTPTDAQYEARYQSLLKRYNISPENYKTSKSGSAEYRESPKTEEPKKSQQKSKPQPKNETKSQTVKNNVKKPSASKNNKKTAPSESTGRPQTSKTGTNTPLKNTDKEPVKAPVKESVKTPPKKDSKTHPVGGWKEENQDVAGTNRQQYRPNRYGYISKTSDLPNMIRYKGLEQFSDYPKKKKSSSPKPVHQKHTYEDDMTRYNKTSGSNKEKEHAKIADEMKKNGKGFVTPSEAYNRRAKLKLGEVSRKGLIKKLTIEDSKADIRKIKKARKF